MKTFLNDSSHRSPASRLIKIALTSMGVVIAVFFIMSWLGGNGRNSADSSNGDNVKDGAVRPLVISEEIMLDLQPVLRDLERSVLNLRLPVGSLQNRFTRKVTVIGQLQLANRTATKVNQDADRIWSIAATENQIRRDDLQLWSQLFEECRYLENVSFQFLKGGFTDSTKTIFRVATKFQGLATFPRSEKSMIQLIVNLDFQRPDESDNWLICRWDTADLQALESDGILFRDVMEIALADVLQIEQLRKSRHEQITTALLKGQSVERPADAKYPWYFPDVTLEHPGLSVVDFDNDGWDDLFVAMHHSRCLLFRNRGDGTFEEIAQDVGIVLTGDSMSGDSTSALFADFDNDGDQDLFLGRAHHRSHYFVNQDGRFVDRSSELIATPLPYMVSSISTADYNGDGLLDVYFATYSPTEELHDFHRRNPPDWARIFLSPDQLDSFITRIDDTHPFLNRPGPPNLLLQGTGDGRFEVAPENDQVSLWRKSLQASWSDLDADGDPDLLVTNEYGGDILFRNDFPDGFTDVTVSNGLTSFAFGSGVTFGDYDCDGRRDIYVAGISSHIGDRIIDRFPAIDPRIKQMAAGNSLFRNMGDVYQRTAENTDLGPVNNGGWCRGVQFIDINNDGFLDLYAANGFYTPPEGVAADIDLMSNFWRSVVRSDDSLDTAIRNSVDWDGEKISDRNHDGIRRFEWKRLEKSKFSFAGNQRNRMFLNRSGERFIDVSGISGSDVAEDGRAVATWDFDRDGFEDIVLANTNSPILRMFRNRAGQLASTRSSQSNFIAIKFVGGNSGASASDRFGPRDGIGALATLQFNDAPRLIQRELRSGEGLATQNSRTLIIGTGTRTSVKRLSILWPSGTTSQIDDLACGQLITAYEDVRQSGTATGFAMSEYRQSDLTDRLDGELPRQSLPAELVRQIPTPLVAITSMASWNESSGLEEWQVIRDAVDSKQLTLLAIPVDPKDGEMELREFASKFKPAYQLDSNWNRRQRRLFKQVVIENLGRTVLPATIIATADGEVLQVTAGIPTVSDIIKSLEELPAN